MELLTSEQMRNIEQAAFDADAATGRSLMERAGRAVVDAIEAHLAAASRRAYVFCGRGNNGGDGYVVARLLRERGWEVRVWATGPATTPDARANADRWASMGGVDGELAVDFLNGAVVVDALFGTGLTRPLDAMGSGALALAQERCAALVAVDILSGVHADSGALLYDGPEPVRGADLTVTFQVPKRGHMLVPGGDRTGTLVVADLGIGAFVEALHRADASRVAVAVRAPGPRWAKTSGHKFDHGHALVVAGGVGRGGAARLAARAALRVGAGLVTVACPPSALIENAARLDAVLLHPLRGEHALTHALSDARIRSLCIGPGLGLHDGAAAWVAQALAARRATVLDADALTWIARTPSLRALVHDRCVLTPHGGEFARLWPHLQGMPKVDACVQAAAEIGATVLYKGADTVIAEPDGWPQIHAALRDRAAPWLATAGSGDVLAGLIAGLLARGWPCADAAADAAWLHAEAARAFGPGLIAEDLPEALPGVLRRIVGA
jgi:hydroxyethylthiazole kinase-like uncharacterized protein yjeF